MKSLKNEVKINKAGAKKLNEFAQVEIKWWLSSIIFIALTAIFFSEHLFSNAFFWEDFAEYVYPIQTFAAREFAGGSIPFWNPYSYVGMPFLADIQVGFFYPLNRILSLFVSSEGTLSVAALQFSLILHFLIAQLAMYFAARHFKISSIGSIISAVSYAFSFLLVCHVIHPMIVIHLAWFPLILMFLSKAMKEADIRSGIISGLLLGMVMLAGHPQMTLYIALFLGLFFLWNLIADIKKGAVKELPIAKYIIAGILPFIIALGIFQIQFMPSKELADLSKRNEMTFEKSAEGSLEIEQIVSSVVPKILGYANAENKQSVQFFMKIHNSEGEKVDAPYYFYWESGYYFGLAALILGLFGAFTGIKNREVAFLVAISIFAFLFAIGSNGFLYKIFHSLPFFSQLRIPARMMYVVAFSFSMLAGFGFDRLSKSSEKSDLMKLLIAAAIPVAVALLTAVGILPALLGADEKFVSAIQGFGGTALAISLIIALLAFLLYKKIANPLIIGSVIALVAFVDLYIAGADFNVSSVDYAKQYELPKQTLDAFRPKYPNDIFRVNMRMYNPSYMALKRNQGPVSGIELIEGYNPLILERVVPPVGNKDKIHSMFNVKYEIAIDSVQGVPFFAERKDRMPRAYLVSSAIIKDENSVEEYMKTNPLDYSKVVVLEEQLPFELVDDSTSAGEVKITKYSNNKISLEVDANRNSVLCLSEIYFPAWTAKVNGKETKIYRSNYCFRAIPIEKGNHKIELEYNSSSFATGKWISISTLLLAIAGLFIGRNKKVQSGQVN